MNSEKTPANRKVGSLITKNLIILIVLVAVCSFSIWSWFTNKQTATADGARIRSKADGVQVSWDGVNYYDNLTALSSSDVVAEKTGLAKNLCDTDGKPLSLSLITGNGIDFFEPYINRRTGTILVDDDLKWMGTEINSTNSSGKYVDIDLYFRSDLPRSVYLAGDSKVSPKNINGNFSEYGDFSKDYIAAASRIAFLNEDKTLCNYIWAPNADVELVENQSGYQMYTTKETEEITISGGGTIDIDGGVADNGKTYYFWTFWDDSVVSSYPDNLNNFEARKFTYDSELKYFVTDVTMYIPTYGGDNPSIPIFINESNSASVSSFNQYNQYIDGASSKNTIREDLGQYYGVTNTDFNVGSAVCSNAMYIINGKIKTGSKVDMKLAYDPYNQLLVVLSYTTSDGGSFNLAGQETDITTEVTYFPLANNTNCALVNPNAGIAISTANKFKKEVQFSNSTKRNVLPISITNAENFTAIKTGDGYSATYKFLNANNNKYLSIDNGTVSFNNSGSEFSLYYMNGVDGPLLKSGDYYLVVQNGNVNAVKIGYLDETEIVTIYTGNTYRINTGLTNDSQKYQYYDYDHESLVNFVKIEESYYVAHPTKITPDEATDKRYIYIHVSRDAMEFFEGCPEIYSLDTETDNYISLSQLSTTNYGTYFGGYVPCYEDGTTPELELCCYYDSGLNKTFTIAPEYDYLQITKSSTEEMQVNFDSSYYTNYIIISDAASEFFTRNSYSNTDYGYYLLDYGNSSQGEFITTYVEDIESDGTIVYAFNWPKYLSTTPFTINGCDTSFRANSDPDYNLLKIDVNSEGNLVSSRDCYEPINRGTRTVYFYIPSYIAETIGNPVQLYDVSRSSYIPCVVEDTIAGGTIYSAEVETYSNGSTVIYNASRGPSVILCYTPEYDYAEVSTGYEVSYGSSQPRAFYFSFPSSIVGLLGSPLKVSDPNTNTEYITTKVYESDSEVIYSAYISPDIDGSVVLNIVNGPGVTMNFGSDDNRADIWMNSGNTFSSICYYWESPYSRSSRTVYFTVGNDTVMFDRLGDWFELVDTSTNERFRANIISKTDHSKVFSAYLPTKEDGSIVLDLYNGNPDITFSFPSDKNCAEIDAAHLIFYTSADFYDVTFRSNISGYELISGGDVARSGSPYTFSLSMNSNYRILYVSVNGEAIQASESSTDTFKTYTVENVTENLAVFISIINLDIKLFTTTNSTSGTVRVGDTVLATLTKENETDEYYTAHIVMRVWVEGTDREAKTPLADGIFDMSLHFIS